MPYCRQRVHWTIALLVLHHGDPNLSALTLDDIEEQREVLGTIDAIPQIRDVLSEQKLPRAQKSWRTMVFQTGVALFHAGLIDQLPKRLPTKERLPLSTLPRTCRSPSATSPNECCSTGPPPSSTPGKRFGACRPGSPRRGPRSSASPNWLQRQRKINSRP